MKRTITAAGMAIALGVGVGGIAVAAVPGADGLIHGCYDTQSGQMRLVDPVTGTPKGCGKNETEVQWTQQGRPGEQGPAGPQGQPGQDATVDAHSTFAADQVAVADSPGASVASIALPPGTYVINVSATARSGDPHDNTLTCRLVRAGETLGGASTVSTHLVPFGQALLVTYANVAITTTASLAASGVVDLSCRNVFGHSYLASIAITAVGVGTLDQQ